MNRFQINQIFLLVLCFSITGFSRVPSARAEDESELKPSRQFHLVKSEANVSDELVAGHSSDDDEDLAAEGKALSANATLASDYVLRGLSQTSHQPAIQGGFDWEHPTGFYLGVWGSNVHFEDSPASLELDAYGGYTYQFYKKTTLSLGALYYTYWADGNRDSWVIPLKGQWNAFTLEVDYSPNWEGSNATSWYFQGGWQDRVIWDVKLGGFVGYSVFTGGSLPDYADVTISASREFLEVEWQLAGVFVNTSVINGSQGGDRAIFSVTKSF